MEGETGNEAIMLYPRDVCGYLCLSCLSQSHTTDVDDIGPPAVKKTKYSTLPGMIDILLTNLVVMYMSPFISNFLTYVHTFI